MSKKGNCRHATVSEWWFGGCALFRRYSARQPTSPPIFFTHREQHGSSSAPFVRSQPLTLALISNPSLGALHAPDTDANHGSQVGPTKLRRTDSENFQSIASRRTHSAPLVYWSWLAPDVPRHLSCTPTTPQSAASCAQIRPTHTDHGSWVDSTPVNGHELRAA